MVLEFVRDIISRFFLVNVLKVEVDKNSYMSSDIPHFACNIKLNSPQGLYKDPK